MASVHAAISSIIGELGGIGKNQRNKEQGYNFRGIDDVLKELHPLLAKYGVVFAPDVVEREYEERISGKGTVGRCANLHVRYKIYGPEGDFIEISTWGEGLDYGDKATNKAMTAAFKYALYEVFAVCDPMEDSDHETPDGGETPKPAPLGPKHQALREALAASHPDSADRKFFLEATTGRALSGLADLSDEEVELCLSKIGETNGK